MPVTICRGLVVVLTVLLPQPGTAQVVQEAAAVVTPTDLMPARTMELTAKATASCVPSEKIISTSERQLPWGPRGLGQILEMVDPREAFLANTLQDFSSQKQDME